MQNGNNPVWLGLGKPAASVNEDSSNDVASPVGEDAVNSVVRALALFERHKKAAITAIEDEEYDHAAERVAELRTMSSEFRKALGLKVL